MVFAFCTRIMPKLPYIILKSAVSVDGFIDDDSMAKLILSGKEDWEKVYEVRASCDAILVGARTVRDDNCMLSIPVFYQQQRESRGLSRIPLRVTLTESGRLSPDLKFFSTADVNGTPLVFCPQNKSTFLMEALHGMADILTINNQSNPIYSVLQKLSLRGVKRLLVEGGSSIGSAFLQNGFVDELQISVAPFFVGNSGSTPFARPGNYPHNAHNRMKLRDVARAGDMALITYQLDGYSHRISA